RAMRLRSPDRDRAAARDLQVGAHDGFVDATDLLDIEGAVAQVFPIENEEIREHPENHVVGNGRRLDALVLAKTRAQATSFEERIAVRIEQVALARRHPQI